MHRVTDWLLQALTSRSWYIGWAVLAAQYAYCRYLLLAISWQELSSLGINISQGIYKDVLLFLIVALFTWTVSKIPGRWNSPYLASGLFIVLAVVTIVLLFSNVVFVRFFERPLDFISLQHIDALMDFDAAIFDLSSTRDLLLGLTLPLLGCLWFSMPPRRAGAPAFPKMRFALGVIVLPPLMFNLVAVRTSGDFTEQNEIASLSHEIIRQFKSGSMGKSLLRYDPAAIFPLNAPTEPEPAAMVAMAREALLPPNRAPARTAEERLSLKQHTKFDFEFSQDPSLRRIEQEIQKRVTTAGRRPNIVLVIVESLRTYELLDPTLSPKIFPFLRELRKQSLYFSRFIAYGVPPNQSAQGHFSYNCGVIPSFFARTVSLSNPDLSIRCMPEILRKQGYSTIFVQGHHKGFQGEFRFYHRHGAQFFYDATSFPPDAPRIGSGVLDSEIFKLANSAFRNPAHKPFYADVQTLTMHVPWGDEAILPKLPPEIDAAVESDAQRQWLRREMYFDRALQQFLENAKRERYFDNTIFFITGDHGIPGHLKGRHPLQMNLQANWSPLLVYAPKLIPPGEVPTLKTHLDLPVGILQMMGIETDHNFVSPGLFPLDRPTQFLGFRGPDALLFTDPESGDYCNSQGTKGQCVPWVKFPAALGDKLAHGMSADVKPYVKADNHRPLQAARKLWLLDYLFLNDLVYPQEGGGPARADRSTEPHQASVK